MRFKALTVATVNVAAAAAAAHHQMKPQTKRKMMMKLIFLTKYLGLMHFKERFIMKQQN